MPTVYQVRCEKDDTQRGVYTLRYGRQGKQLSQTLKQEGKEWRAGAFKGATKSEAKEKWGAWAKANYSEGSPNGAATMLPTAQEVADAAREGASSPPKLGGPPKLGAKKPAPASPPSLSRPKPPALSKQDAADPFNPIMRYPSDHPKFPRQTTPLGLLVEIREWYFRYKDRVDSVNKVLTADGQWPGYNPFLSLIDGVNEVINRECPNVPDPSSDSAEGNEEDPSNEPPGDLDHPDSSGDDLQGDDIDAGLEDPNLITVAPGVVRDADGEYEDPLRA